MSKSPRALQELMTAVDAGHAVDVVHVHSASSDSTKLLTGPPRRRRSTAYHGRGGGARKMSAPAAVLEAAAATDNASFEFSAVVSYSSASPASMVFSDGQLRAHQFPAVRSSAGSSVATSPGRSSSSVRSGYSSSTSTTKQRRRRQAGVTTTPTGSKKRVSFAMDGADKAAAGGKAAGGGGQGKKSGGLLGCMASACGPSSRNEAVEPVARNDNRKVVAF